MAPRLSGKIRMSNVIAFRRPASATRGVVFAAAFTERVCVGDQEIEGASRFCFVVQDSPDKVGISRGDFSGLAAADDAALKYAETHGYTFLPWFAPLCGGVA